MRCARIAAQRVLVAMGVVVALTAAPAHAGTFAVTGGCEWSPSNGDPSRLAIYGDCAGLTVRHVRGAFNTPSGAQAQWTFVAPPGTVIGSAQMSGDIRASDAWDSRIFTDTGAILAMCPAYGCPGPFAVASGYLGATQLALRVRCGGWLICSNHDPLKASISAHSIVLHLHDSSAPTVAITGGDLFTGWRRGAAFVSLNASDNVGIKLDRLLVDGTVREQRVRTCIWGARVPCWNGGAVLSLDTSLLSDGQHTVAVQSVDAADNAGGPSHVISIDNTAPAAPLGTTLAGGSTWRATNGFSLSWRNPTQAHAPIATVRYQVCPLANASSDTARCVTGQRSAADINRIQDLVTPDPGEWRARFWLVDAAGNDDPRTAVESVLRFDNEPPNVVFREQATDDPARLRVSAADATSDISDVKVEVRRQGDDAWTELTTQASGGDVTAFMDDESLPAGTYDLRARAVDLAGNERTTLSRSNGQPAVLELPVRHAASLQVGQASVRCTKRARRRTCRPRLADAPMLEFGRKATLEGELRIDGRPSTGTVEVWRQLRVPGASWEPFGSVQASTGRFRFDLPAGPARLYRFRYPGSPTARGATELVDARVRAATTFEPSHREVVNGEYITFRGRLRGGLVPPGGKLVELQVFTRRRWRTFAQPRASATTGRWSFQYRFEAVRGRVRFRFRARIRREASYPFHAGTSRQVVVTVHGI